MINVRVITSDRSLVETCRTVLDEICQTDHQVLEGHSPGDPPQVCIWEIAAASKLADAPHDLGTRLIVVSNEPPSCVRDDIPRICFLPSPITGPALRTALESMISSIDEGCDHTLSRQVVNADCILRRLLENTLRREQSDHDRMNHLSRLAYEIQVALTALEGYCGLLVAGQCGKLKYEQTAILEKMEKHLARLEGVATAMTLCCSKVGLRTPAGAEAGDLDACASQAVREIQWSAAQKHITIKIALDAPREGLRFNFGQLSRALVSLLESSCKVSPKHGCIQLVGYPLTGRDTDIPETFSCGYRVDIIDTGPTIPVERADSMFDDCASYGGPADRAGAGLSLAICRMIIHAHGGRIWATPGGSGGKVSFVLPYSRTQNPQSTPRELTRGTI